MEVIRRLVKRGNSFHVSLPPQIVNHLRLRVTDPLHVRVTERGTIEIRLAHEADFRRSPIPPMTITPLAAVTK